MNLQFKSKTTNVVRERLRQKAARKLQTLPSVTGVQARFPRGSAEPRAPNYRKWPRRRQLPRGACIHTSQSKRGKDVKMRSGIIDGTRDEFSQLAPRSGRYYRPKNSARHNSSAKKKMSFRIH